MSSTGNHWLENDRRPPQSTSCVRRAGGFPDDAGVRKLVPEKPSLAVDPQAAHHAISRRSPTEIVLTPHPYGMA